MKLSIVMMIKNEGKHLDASLKSVSEILNRMDSELIIVDTGSEDDSMDIAKKYTNKVYHHKWNNDFAAMRNKTLNYASGDWVFVLDGDEIIEDPRSVVEFINSSKAKKFNTVSVKLKNITKQSDDKGYGKARILRLFRKTKKLKYRGKIHEQPIYETPVFEADISLIHYGYNSDDPLLMETKFVRNKSLLEKELEKNPNNIYYLYQLSVTYGMHKDNPDALIWAQKAYQVALENKIDLSRRMYVYTNLANTLLKNKKFKETRRICVEAISVNDRYIDLFYFLGISQFNLNENKNAICSFKTYLTLLDDYEKGQLETANDPSTALLSINKKEEVLLHLAELYYQESDMSSSLTYIESITDVNIIQSCFLLIIKIYLQEKNFKGILDFYINRVECMNDRNSRNYFYESLELQKRTIPYKEQLELCEVMSKMNNEYGTLNSLRLGNDIENKFDGVDFNQLPSFYGEVIYHWIKESTDRTISIFKDTREDSLKKFFIYIKNNYNDSITTIVDLINDLISLNEDPRIIAKSIKGLSATYILEKTLMDEESERFLIEKYIEYGFRHLYFVYSQAIIQEKLFYDVKNAEDVFLMHLLYAIKDKKDQKQYIRHLRESIKVFPKGKSIINYILERDDNQFEENNESNESNSDELNALKRELKDNIITLINEGYLDEAKKLIAEYEDIDGGKDDVELYSIKGVVLITEGALEDAESVLIEGLENDENNFDLLYNLAYCSQLNKDYVKAFQLYNKAKGLTSNDEMKQHINEILDSYNDIEEIKRYNSKLEAKNVNYPKVTIIIPAYNQKGYLKQAIESCLTQDYPNLEIIVGDDCSTDGTHVMMREYKGNNRVKYIRNPKNLGAGNNSTNLLYNYAEGEYGMILNHDDYLIDDHYISLAVELLANNNNLSFVWANCKIKNEITGKESITTFKNKKITNGIEYFLNYETPNFPHITGVLTTVFDIKKLRSTNYGFEKTKSKDLFLYLKLMLVGDVGFINKCVSVYRVHNDSISYNMPREFDQTTIDEFEKLRDEVLDQGVAYSNIMDKWINNRIFSYVIWRFTTLWNNGNKKDGIELLMSISNKYPTAYNTILNKI